MKNIKKLLAVAELVAGALLIYFGITTPFGSIIFNIVLPLVGVYVLLDSFEKMDEINGNGPYNKDNQE